MPYQGNLLSKTLVIGIIILFIGMSVVSSTKNIVVNGPANRSPIESFDSSEELLFRGKTAYAYIAYGGGSGHPEGPCCFDLDDPGNITFLLGTASNNFLSGGTWSIRYEWLGVEYCTGVLWHIHTKNGEMHLYGGGGTSLNDITWDEWTRTLYGTSCTTLYEIEPITGEQTPIGDYGDDSICMYGLACNNNSICYCIGVNLNWTNSYLYTVNTSTGETTLVAVLINHTGEWNAEFDKNNDILYLIGDCLSICDTETGECNLVGWTDGGAELTSLAIPYEDYSSPDAPTIDGPTSGKVRVEYEYNFSISDPNKNDVKCIIWWGDFTRTETDWYPSGTNVTVKHSWRNKGTYTIEAMTIDINGLRSPWSYIKVMIPRNRATIDSLFQLLLDRFPLLEVFLRAMNLLR